MTNKSYRSAASGFVAGQLAGVRFTAPPSHFDLSTALSTVVRLALPGILPAGRVASGDVVYVVDAAVPA